MIRAIYHLNGAEPRPVLIVQFIATKTTFVNEVLAVFLDPATKSLGHDVISKFTDCEEHEEFESFEFLK